MLITSCPLSTSNGSRNLVAVCHGPKCLGLQLHEAGDKGRGSRNKKVRVNSNEFPEEVVTTRDKSGNGQNLTKCRCRRYDNGTLMPLQEQVRRMKNVAKKKGQDGLNNFWRTDEAGDMFGLFKNLNVSDNGGNPSGFAAIMDQIGEASKGLCDLPNIACRCASCGAWFSEEFKEFSKLHLSSS